MGYIDRCVCFIAGTVFCGIGAFGLSSSENLQTLTGATDGIAPSAIDDIGPIGLHWLASICAGHLAQGLALLYAATIGEYFVSHNL